VPDYQTYNFGNVPLNETRRITISYLLDPQFTNAGPFVLSNPSYFFYYDQEGAFSVDPSTSCLPGVTITATSGCTITMVFAPATMGPKVAQWFELLACQGISPTCPGSVASTLIFLGDGVPSVVPAISRMAYLLLVLFFLAAGGYAMHVRNRAS
jgi:hypothetical protein